jgi:hypothetical protein
MQRKPANIPIIWTPVPMDIERIVRQDGVIRGTIVG